MRSFLIFGPLFSLSLCSPEALAEVFIAGTAGPAFAYMPGGKAVSTLAYQGSARWGYFIWPPTFSVGLDLDAFRLTSGGGLQKEVDGNVLRLAFEYSGEVWNTWVAGGAGELRTYDRAEEKDRPYRYYVAGAEWGISYNYYRAEYGALDFNLVFKHMQPDQDWQDKFEKDSISSVQLGVGFKLINW